MIGDFEITDILGFIVILLVMGYVGANRRFLPGGWGNIFLLAFLALGAGVVSANVEKVFAPALFNLLEHAFRAAFAILLAVGCWNLAAGAPEEEREE